MTDPGWNLPGQQPGQPPAGSTPSGGFAIPPAPPVMPPYEQAAASDPLISQDYGGWFSRGTTIVKRAWKELAVLQAVGLVLVLLVQAPIAVFVAFRTDDLQNLAGTGSPDEPPDFGLLFGIIGAGLLVVLISVILTAIITLASVHIGVSAAVGAPVRIGDALGLAVRRVFPLLGWQILAIPIYIAGLCLCLLPILYVAAVFTVLPVVVAAERTNAIGRCFKLFHGNLGASAGRIATIIGFTFGVALVANLFGTVISAAAESGSVGRAGLVFGTVAATGVEAVISGALAILLAPLTLTAYADMRSRVEPISSATIAHELGIATDSWASPPGFQTPPPYPSY